MEVKTGQIKMKRVVVYKKKGRIRTPFLLHCTASSSYGEVSAKLKNRMGTIILESLVNLLQVVKVAGGYKPKD